MRAMLQSSATFGERVPPDRRSMILSARVVPEMSRACCIIFYISYTIVLNYPGGFMGSVMASDVIR
jgi:hypothetical protein